jgi:hypothetical protein
VDVFVSFSLGVSEEGAIFVDTLDVKLAVGKIKVGCQKNNFLI